MKHLATSLLVFICIQPIGLCAMPTAVNSAQQQQKPHQEEKCTQYGISPNCDYELDEQKKPLGHPTDTYTNEEALQAIKDGYGTPEKFYQEQTITLQQKQWLELQLAPERL